MRSNLETLVCIGAVLAALIACKKFTGESDPTPIDSALVAPTSTTTKPRPPRKLFDSDLASVCNEMPEKRAAPYVKKAGEIHPTIVFARKGTNEKYIKDYSKEFKAWKADKAEDYQLVACVTTKSRTKVKECKFDQKKPVRYLEVHDATFEITVHEASTGKKVAEKTASLKASKKCPMFWMFNDVRDIKDPDFDQTVIDLAKPFAMPK